MDVGTVQRVDIDETMRTAYLSYAMSVITARALPDVRDGLKPVQRRILYAMADMGLTHNSPTRKCARIVGEVLGKYHPHGDAAVYEALVRLAQDFTMRYPLVFGQGNFGSVDGDGAAAMRYTEARLAALGEELLVDLEKDTVDFRPNFDGSLNEPTVLPAKLPNLLLNGVGGIAVGMATNIPPHNLGELADAIAYLVDHYNKVEEVSLDELMRFIPGPDFPTGGTILGREGIRQAYATGKGRVIMRANAHVEELRGHSAIIVTELPYQVNKANLVERIADLARNARIEGIADLRDESDRTGMRVVVELKRGVEPAPVLAGLLKLTQMQYTFGVNALALVEGVPRVLPLKRILLHYIEHRHEVLFRRTKFELARAEARAHVLEGLLIALDNLDEVINTIRRSKTAETAQTNLCQRFKLTEIQARAILDMQLRRLAALERQKIEEECKEVTKQIKYLKGLLANKTKILALVKEDVLDLKTRYGDARRTRIVDAEENAEFRAVDLAPDEQVCVTLSAEGIVRRQAASARNLEALGISAAPGDGPLALFTANTREQALWFSDRGRAFLTPVHQVPDVVQVPQGVSIGRLVHLDEGEKIVAVCHLTAFEEGRFVSIITRQGKVKRLAVSELASCGIAGAVAIGLTEDDRLLAAMLTVAGEELLVVTEQAKAIRFQGDTVRPQGAAASGMRGITLKEGDVVVAAEVVVAEGQLLLATANGYAKRAAASEFPVQGRGGNGVAAADPAKANLTGPVVDARFVAPSDSVALVSSTGSVHLVSVADVPKLGRASWGRLVTASRRYAVVQLKDDTLVRCVPLGSVPEAAAPAAPSPTTRGARATRQSSTKSKAGPAVQPEQDLAKPARRPVLRRGAKTPAAPAAPPPEAPAPSARKRATPAKGSAAKAAPEQTPASPAAASRTTRKRATETQAAPKQTRRPVSEPPLSPKPARAPVDPSATPARPARKAGDAAAAASKPAAEEKQPAEQPAPAKSSRTRRTTVSKPPERGRSRKGSSQ
jgi:DNA gyrase subunit A